MKWNYLGLGLIITGCWLDKFEGRIEYTKAFPGSSLANLVGLDMFYVGLDPRIIRYLLVGFGYSGAQFLPDNT
jgi:hypothetical protein